MVHVRLVWAKHDTSFNAVLNCLFASEATITCSGIKVMRPNYV